MSGPISGRTILKKSVIPFFLLWCFSAEAKIKLLSVTGASNFIWNTTTDGGTIYGGVAGTCTSTDQDGTSTCDSCKNARTPATAYTSTILSCNSKSIYSGLALHIEFSTDNKDLFTSSSAIEARQGTSNITLKSSSIVTTVKTNTSLYADILWSDICPDVFDSTKGYCSTTSLVVGINTRGDGATAMTEQMTFTLAARGIYSSDKDYHTSATATSNCSLSNEGFCYFEVAPGDEKVYLKNFSYNSTTYPQTGVTSVPYSGVRIYYQKGSNVTSLSLLTASYKDLTVDTTADPVTVNPVTIRDLTNKTTYSFMMANLDAAGNVSFFSNPNTFFNATFHSATPDEVVGVLDGQKCFIATAAFGSAWAPPVRVLRNFRDSFLLSHSWGRDFVRWYYQNSPEWADKIKQDEHLRAAVRFALWPVVFVADLFLHPWMWGVLLGLGILFWNLRKSRAKNILGLFLLLFFFTTTSSLVHAEELFKPGPIQEDEVVPLKEGGLVETEKPPQEPPYVKAEEFPVAAEQRDFEKKEAKPRETQLEADQMMRPGVQKIPHPLAAKGLIRIESNGTYVYKVESQKSTEISGLRLGQIPSPKITNNLGVAFERIYGGSYLNYVQVDYGFKKSSFLGAFDGILGLGFGMSSGKGIFKDTLASSEESYSFYAVPLSAMALYRFEYMDHQWVSPYIGGGATVIGLLESRDDDKRRWDYSPGFVGVGGVHLSLGALDDQAAMNLRREYGINQFWITVEYKVIQSTNTKLDFSSNFISAGVTAEY